MAVNVAEIDPSITINGTTTARTANQRFDFY